MLKALSSLLGGLTAIPAAKLRQFAQGIDDVTNARSATASIVAKAAGTEAIRDPLLARAAAEIYLPTSLRKARNRLLVAQSATDHISQANSDGASAQPPEEDWMNSFMKFAEDASSDRLQDLFGRILAGQVVRPGAFGSATLRAVSELDQSIAEDFSYVWARSVGLSVDCSEEFHRGEGFERWKRLSEAGLMAPAEIAQFPPTFTPVMDGNGLWTPMQVDGAWLNVHFPENCNGRWANIPFARAGREIGSLLVKPDFENNMRAAGQRLTLQGVTRVELCSIGRLPEIIFCQGGVA